MQSGLELKIFGFVSAKASGPEAILALTIIVIAVLGFRLLLARFKIQRHVDKR